MLDFLVIGSMKSATTTLYFDLYQSPHISLPTEKESATLLLDFKDDAEYVDQYRQLFKRADAREVRGEVCTDYSKRPDVQPPAALAERLFGSSLRIIYLVRDPIDRAVSHFRHNRRHGYENRPLGAALQDVRQYTDYGRYSYQLEPWVEHFGRDAILPVPFEAYASNRGTSLDRIAAHLSVPPFSDAIDDDKIFNQSTGRSPVPQFVRALTSSRLYDTVIRRHVHPRLRVRIADLFAVIGNHHQGEPEYALDAGTRAMLMRRLARETGAFVREWNLDVDWATCRS